MQFNKEYWEVLTKEITLVNQKSNYGQFTKKEVKVSNLILSSEGLTKYITDLQEMSVSSKYAMDGKGNYKYDDEGNRLLVDIPLVERWVSLGDIKWNGEKFVVKVSDSTLDAMEKLNARKIRTSSYEAA